MPFIGKQTTASNSKITKYVTTVGSGGQTNFSISTDVGGDVLQVFLNGVLLKETTDYTVSSTQVSLVSPAVEDDILEVHVYRSFILVDAVQKTGDDMTGELVVPTVKLSSNVIKASDGGSTITLDDSDNVTVAGNVKVGGNIIQASDGGNTLTLDTSDNLTVAGNIQVGGNVIKASDGGSTITLDNSDNVTVAGGLTVTGGITNAGTISAGTIGGSVVFPAGKIINVWTENEPINSTSSTAHTAIYKAVTLSSTSNDVIVFIGGTIRKTSTATGGHLRAYIEGGGFGSGTSGLQVAGQIGYGEAGDHEHGIGFIGVDTTPGSTSVQYGLYINPVSSATMSYALTIVVMEVVGTIG